MFSMLMAIGSTTSIQQIIDMHDKKLLSRPLLDGIPPLFYATLERNPELLMLLLSKKPELSYTFNPNRGLRITYPDINTELEFETDQLSQLCRDHLEINELTADNIFNHDFNYLINKIADHLVSNYDQDKKRVVEDLNLLINSEQRPEIQAKINKKIRFEATELWKVSLYYEIAVQCLNIKSKQGKLFLPDNGDIFTFLATTNQLALFLKAATRILNEEEFSNELKKISNSRIAQRYITMWNKSEQTIPSHYYVILHSFISLLDENFINESIKEETVEFLNSMVNQLASEGLDIPQIIQWMGDRIIKGVFIPNNVAYLLYYLHHHFIRTNVSILNNHPLSTVKITENKEHILNQVKQQEYRCILRPYKYLQSLAKNESQRTKPILAELNTLADMKIIKRFIKDALFIIENMSLEKLTEDQFNQWLNEIHWETIEPATSIASIYKLLNPILGSDVIAKYNAVFKIQSFSRMAPVRRDYKTIIKGVTRLQGLQRIKTSKKVLTEKLMTKTQTDAAIKIQNFLKSCIYKIKSKVISKPIQDWENKSQDFWASLTQKRKEEANAIKIQSAYRTFKKKSTFKQQQQASLKIQTNWRRYRSQNKFNQMKHAITKILRQTRNMLKKQWSIQRNNAALKINKALTPLFRRVKAREKTRALIAQFKEADNALLTGLREIESTINSQADMMFYKTKNSHVFGILNKEGTYLIAGKMGTVFMKNNQIHTGFAYLGEKTAENISVTIRMDNKTTVTKKFKCYLVQEQRFDRKICHKYGIKIHKIRSEMMKLV